MWLFLKSGALACQGRNITVVSGRVQLPDFNSHQLQQRCCLRDHCLIVRESPYAGIPRSVGAMRMASPVSEVE